MRLGRSDAVVAAAILVLLALNLVVLAEALPETRRVDSGCCSDHQLAKDFSAYYVASWRLAFDPSHVYAPPNASSGGPSILPRPEVYKYLPSMLLFILPFLALPYQEALTAFDLVQFALLCLTSLLVSLLVRGRGATLTVAVATIVILLPVPGLGSWLSQPYYWQWAEGQSKVLETFLLVVSFYLGTTGKTRLSGAALGLSGFDPRFTLLAIPLFLASNRTSLVRSCKWGAAIFALTNSALLYSPIGGGFVSVLLSSGLSTPVYPYSFIPIATVLSLSAARYDDIRSLISRPG